MSCEPVIVPNEFITTLLNNSDKKELAQINRHLTDTVINCVCPSGNSIINILSSQKNINNKPTSKPDKNVKSTHSCCNQSKRNKNAKSSHSCCNPINPANTILYGGTICQNLLILNTLELNNHKIKSLEELYNVIW